MGCYVEFISSVVVVMISLNDYLNQIYLDFKKYVENSSEYCELLDLDFSKEDLPNYQKEGIVQLYLLRYAYAYLFEYKYLFQKIIPPQKALQALKPIKLKILSVGCGAFLDYWGAALASNAVNPSCVIKYTGIDPVDWKYKINPRQRDSIQFEKKNFCNFLKATVESGKELDVNVLVFPKSIGEFSSDEFREICALLKRCKFKCKRIVLVFSYRDCTSQRSFDMNRVAMIVDSFKNHRSISFAVSNFDRGQCNKIKSMGIRAMDSDFIYPDKIIEYIKSLSNICNKQGKTLGKCMDCAKSLSRWPILKTTYITYSLPVIDRKE